MNAFLKKELKEIMKTYRIWAVPALFIFIGFSSPATAKFLPDILKTQLEAQNITLKLPEPSATEAFQQYFKNMTQLGMLGVILMSMGLVAEEKARGILAQVVTKPVSRPAIILAKLFMQGGWFLVSLAVGAVGCYLYTVGLFGQADAGRFLTANLFFAAYLMLIFSLTLAAGAALRNQTAVAGVGLAGFFVLSIIPTFGRVFARYSPAALSDLAFKAISNPVSMGDAVWPVLTSVMLGALLLGGGIYIFNRQEL